MEAEQKGFQKDQLVAALKKHWKLASVAVLLLSFIFFREFTVQLILLVLALAAIGFVLYKVGIFTFVIASGLVKGTLSLFAFIIAILLIVMILSKIQM